MEKGTEVVGVIDYQPHHWKWVADRDCKACVINEMYLRCARVDGVRVGDCLLIREYEFLKGSFVDREYTGNEMVIRISSITRSWEGLAGGFSLIEFTKVEYRAGVL